MEEKTGNNDANQELTQAFSKLWSAIRLAAEAIQSEKKAKNELFDKISSLENSVDSDVKRFWDLNSKVVELQSIINSKDADIAILAIALDNCQLQHVLPRVSLDTAIYHGQHSLTMIINNLIRI